MSEGPFYIRWRGRLDGPFSLDEIKKMLASGRVSLLHDVSTDRSDWRQVKECPELQPPPVPSKAGKIAQHGAAPGAARMPAQEADLALDDGPLPEPQPEPPPADGGATWYCELEGQVEGPFSHADLLRMVSLGRLGPSSRVSCSRTPERWDFVRDVPELAEAAGGVAEAIWDTSEDADAYGRGPSTRAVVFGAALALLGVALGGGMLWLLLSPPSGEVTALRVLAAVVAGLSGLVCLVGSAVLLAAESRRRGGGGQDE